MSRIKGENYIYTEYFKEVYKNMKYTQETLSEKADVPVSTLKHWTSPKNQRPIPIAKAKLLASALGVDVYEIIGTDGRTSFAKQQRESLAVADAFTAKDIELIAMFLSRHGKQPLFESDNEELNEYRDEYFGLLIDSLLSAHDQFVKMADIAERHGRHEKLLRELNDR